MHAIGRSLWSRRALATALSLVMLALPSILPTASADAGDDGNPAVAHRGGGKPVKAKNLPRGHVLDIGHDAIEPTLGITSEEKIFYAAVGGIGTDIMRSLDGGKTWDNASPRILGRNSHPITLDPYLFVDEPTGRVFTIDLTVACSYMSYSDDDGDSWVTNPLACGRPINDHQTLFAGPPAITPMTVYPHVVYYCWNDFGAGTSCSKSVDGGVGWTVTGSPVFAGYRPSETGGVEQCGGFNGHGVVGADGTVYLPKEYCGQPWLGISHDEGATWTQVQVASNTTERLGSDSSVAVDEDGNLYYMYGTAGRLPFLVTSTDGGVTWSKPVMVGPPGIQEVNLPTMDVGKPGRVAMGYMGSLNSPFQKCGRDCSVPDYADVTWNGYITISTNALSGNPLFLTASVNDPSDPLRRQRCDFFSGRCGDALDFMDIEISPNGRAYAAFVDGCTESCSSGGPNQGGAGIVGTLVGGQKLR